MGGMLVASVKSWNIHQLKCQTWDIWSLCSNLSCAWSLVLPRCFPPSATCAQVFNWSNSESHQKKRQSCLLLAACYPTYQIFTAKPFSILLEIFCSIHPPICRSLVDSANASDEALVSSSLYDSFHLLSIQFPVSSVETTCLLCRSLRPEGKPSALSWFATKIFKRINYGSETKTEENSQDAHMCISNPETFPTSQ